MKFKELLHPFSIRRNLLISVSLLVVGGSLILVASLIGISDNLPGILLCFLGVLSLIFSFIHHWRNVKSYKVLFFVSMIGLFVFAVLHNFLDFAGQHYENSHQLLSQFLNFLSVIFFLVAVFVCPFTMLIGLAGFIIIKYRERKSKNAFPIR